MPVKHCNNEKINDDVWLNWLNKPTNGLKPYCLQNDMQNPTIAIDINSPEWDTAFNNWLQGKPPTNAPDWKKGIFLLFSKD